MTDNVFEIRPKPSGKDIKALVFSQRIDETIVRGLSEGLTGMEIAVILANRLGETTRSAHNAVDTPFDSLEVALEYAFQVAKDRCFRV